MNSDLFNKKRRSINFIGALFIIGAFMYYLLSGQALHADTGDIPNFYKNLSIEKGDFSIIEYPSIIQDRHNPFLRYRSLHKKKVLNGFFISHALKKQWGFKKIYNTDIWPLEIIANRLEIKKLYFTSLLEIFGDLIDLYDINAIRDGSTRYIILHKDIGREISAIQHTLETNGANNQLVLEHTKRFSLHFKDYYLRYFGNPVYEDDVLIVFWIK